MKILMISHEFPPLGGGGANACYYLGKGFARQGHQVTLITTWYPELEERERQNGIEIVRVKSKRKQKEQCSFGEMFSYLKMALVKADKLHRQNQYDICHIFFGIPSGPVGYYLKHKYSLPYVIRFGGGDIPGFQERFTLIYKILSPFIKLIWKRADALVVNSYGLRKMALKFYRKKEFLIINNGVDINAFYPAKDEKSTGKVKVLFVSRLIERKGLQFIIPIWNDILEETAGAAELIVVGEGPYRKNLEELVQKYAVADSVHFEGGKRNAELLKYYQSADLFILPSKKEGMPNVILEAMSCGLPIVMTPCEGSLELIEDNGIVCRLGEMKTALTKEINDENLRVKQGKKSREIIESKFGWNNVVNQYLQLFSVVINK